MNNNHTALQSETDELNINNGNNTPEICIPLSDFRVAFPPIKTYPPQLKKEALPVTMTKVILDKIKQKRIKREEENLRNLKRLTDPQSPEISDTIKKNLFKLISMFYISKKFISNLRTSTVFRTAKFLKKHHFSIINDKSFSWESWQYNYSFKGWKFYPLQFLKNIFRFLKPSVFLPQHPFRLCFDVLMIFSTCLLFILIPVSIGFGLNLDFLKFNMKMVIQALFFLEILFNFNTAFLEKGELVKKRGKICKKYLRGQFLFDCLSSFCLFYWFLNAEYKFQNSSFNDLFPLFFFFRVFNIISLINKFDPSSYG